MVTKACTIVFSLIFIMLISSTAVYASTSDVPGWLDTQPASADRSVIYGMVSLNHSNTSREVLAYDSGMLINRTHGVNRSENSYPQWYRIEVKRNSTVRLEAPGMYIENRYPDSYGYGVRPVTINATEPSIRQDLNTTIVLYGEMGPFDWMDPMLSDVLGFLLGTCLPIVLVFLVLAFILAIGYTIMRRIRG